ncbi:MAG: bifunctional nicotinamidase/pyrazinamidase [Chlamydiales bacterium]
MKTLIITDVQRDFLPGGTLAIPGSDAIIPVINQILPKFEHVFATLDWHPPHHVSFASIHNKKAGEVIQVGDRVQILWPVHCVQNTHGASMAPGLHKDQIEAVFHKGTDPKVDSYSTFFDNARKRSTGLANHLRKQGLNDLYFVGLATDYCILYSVLDSLELGFRTWVVRDACRAINLKVGDEERAFKAMQIKGAQVILSSEIR